MKEAAEIPHGLMPERMIQSLKGSQGAKVLRDSAIMRPFRGSPLAEAFCTVFGPVIYWLSVPANSAATIGIMLLAPVIIFALLPAFIVLIPILLILGSAGVAASSTEGAIHESSAPNAPARKPGLTLQIKEAPAEKKKAA